MLFSCSPLLDGRSGTFFQPIDIVGDTRMCKTWLLDWQEYDMDELQVALDSLGPELRTLKTPGSIETDDDTSSGYNFHQDRGRGYCQRYDACQLRSRSPIFG